MKKSTVYFLPWAEKERLIPFLEASNSLELFNKNDLVAVKIHFGERGGDGHIKPELIKPIVKTLKKKKCRPFMTDTNTIYSGPRNNAVSHLEVAAEHGYSLNRIQTPILIADGLRGDDYRSVKIEGKHFKSVKIASGILLANSMLVLSHFKGHILCGFGGAVKNLGMGCGSRTGKFEMHSGSNPVVAEKKCIACGACIKRCAHNALSIDDNHIVLSKDNCVGCGECIITCPTDALSIDWAGGSIIVQERLAEYALGAVHGKKPLYINFLNHITPNCDCMGMKEKPLIEDIGILASFDPVAIDQACYDLIVKEHGDIFAKAHNGIDGTVQLKHAEEMGLGTRKYELK